MNEEGRQMAKTKMAREWIESKNKALVIEAFETLFNKRDYAAAERFWSPNYIQHSAHIPPGREGLFNLVRPLPETLHYENQLIVAEGDYAIVHGRFTGMERPAAWILGASGNTGSIVANFLLSKGKKVRVVGRDSGRLQRFVDKGAEAFTATVSDATALTRAFSGARAAYLLLPPAKSREEQERDSDGIARVVKESGLRYAVHLSTE